jgi:hypothetical protein
VKREREAQVKETRMILKFFVNRFNFFDLSEEQVGYGAGADNPLRIERLANNCHQTAR